MQFGNESSVTASRWPPYRSYDVIMYDVIACHEKPSVNNFAQKRGGAVGCSAVGVIVFVLSGRIDWYAIWHTWVFHQVRSFDLTWGQIFKSTFSGQDAYVPMHLDEWNTMVFGVFSIFPIKKTKQNAKTLMSPKSSILTCPGKVKMWHKVVKSGIVRFRTS